jgi:hypothetical protein
MHFIDCEPPYLRVLIGSICRLAAGPPGNSVEASKIAASLSSPFEDAAQRVANEYVIVNEKDFHNGQRVSSSRRKNTQVSA